MLCKITLLYCLGNNDKGKKSFHVIADTVLKKHNFNARLVESTKGRVDCTTLRLKPGGREDCPSSLLSLWVVLPERVFMLQ